LHKRDVQTHRSQLGLIKAQVYDRKLIAVRDFNYLVNDARHWGRRVLPDIRQNKGILAKALFTFAAESESELSFNEGDALLIHGEMGNGWLSAKRLSNSQTGIIPENYVEYCDSD
jgi:hypothetical protein